MPSPTSRAHRTRWLTGLAGAAALVIAFPAVAFAAPPGALLLPPRGLGRRAAGEPPRHLAVAGAGRLERLPAGLREKLSTHDFGKADFVLKDPDFGNHLTKAKPSGITFDAHA